MELHWLCFLVITIMVTNSTQTYYDTPQDVQSYKTGLTNAVSYQLQQPGLVPTNLGQYPPLTWSGTGTSLGEDVVQPLRGRGKHHLWKQQQRNARKLRKVMLKLKKALRPLVTLLEDDDDDDDEPQWGRPTSVYGSSNMN